MCAYIALISDDLATQTDPFLEINFQANNPRVTEPSSNTTTSK